MTSIKAQKFGRYQLGDEVGKGGMAVVYKAYDARLEKQVALKIIRTDRITPEMANKTLKRFEREAKSAAQLDHPNIIKVLDYGETNDNPYIVMEYLPGGTLKKRLAKSVVPWQNAIATLLPVAHALRFAHERNIVHRDVKPSNILFNQADQPVLSDFGIVKILGEEATQDLSSTGFMIGTPEYMSPEQAQGANFDHRVDIYALGIVFYEMVTGRRPFSADTPMGVLVKQVTEPLPRPTRFNKNLPASIENFLLKALAKDPVQRFQTMNEVINSFNQLLRSDGRSLSSYGTTSTFSTIIQDPETVTQTYEKKKPTKSWLPWAIITGGIITVLLCFTTIGAGWALGFFESEPPRAEQTPPTAAAVVIPNPTKITGSTNTPFSIAANTPLPTKTSTPVPIPIYELERCSNSNEDICVYSINPQPNNTLIVAFIFKDSLNSSSLPYLMVENQRFKCEILVTYPGRLYCNGPSIAGDKEFSIYSPENKLLTTGIFSIPKYVAPSPTPRKGGGGGNYP